MPDVRLGLNQLVVQPLMVAFAVIVLFDELSNRLAQRLLAEENQALQALPFQTPVESLQVCIQIGRSRRQHNWLNAGLLQQPATLPGELAVPVHQDILWPASIRVPVLVGMFQSLPAAAVLTAALATLGGVIAKLTGRNRSADDQRRKENSERHG